MVDCKQKLNCKDFNSAGCGTLGVIERCLEVRTLGDLREFINKIPMRYDNDCTLVMDGCAVEFVECDGEHLEFISS